MWYTDSYSVRENEWKKDSLIKTEKDREKPKETEREREREREREKGCKRIQVLDKMLQARVTINWKK